MVYSQSNSSQVASADVLGRRILPLREQTNPVLSCGASYTRSRANFVRAYRHVQNSRGWRLAGKLRCPRTFRIARWPLRRPRVVIASCDRPGSNPREHHVSRKFTDAKDTGRNSRNRLFREPKSSRSPGDLAARLKHLRTPV